MKRAVLALLLALPLAADPPASPDTSGIRRATVETLEKRVNERLSDPFDLMGTTRGLYVDGFGAVFTAELSLVFVPNATPFSPKITTQDRERIYQRKVKSLAELRQTMRGLLVTAADSLVMIPKTDEVVLAVRLLYLSWEKTDGLPAQIVMRADRASLLQKGAALTAIRTEEF